MNGWQETDSTLSTTQKRANRDHLVRLADLTPTLTPCRDARQDLTSAYDPYGDLQALPAPQIPQLSYCHPTAGTHKRQISEAMPWDERPNMLRQLARGAGVGLAHRHLASLTPQILPNPPSSSSVKALVPALVLVSCLWERFHRKRLRSTRSS